MRAASRHCCARARLFVRTYSTPMKSHGKCDLRMASARESALDSGRKEKRRKESIRRSWKWVC